MTTSSRAPAKRRFKRVLAVRMLAAQTAWLDSRLWWREGRVVWQHSHGELMPSPADLAQAQRSLYKIEHYPKAANSALGDGAAG